MRIKKKHVLKEARLLEALMIDEISSISPQVKKILKSLHKKYVKDDSFRYWRLSPYDIVDELTEHWLLPFDMSYKIAQLFVFHGDQLFSDTRIKTEYTSKDVLRGYFGRFLKKYREYAELNDDYFDNWDLNVGGEVAKHRIAFWDHSSSFTLYMPAKSDWSLPSRERKRLDERLILADVRFNFEGEEATIAIKYELGERDTDKIEGTILERAIIDLPEELNETTFNKWVEDLINNQIKHVIEDFKFPDPPTETEETE